MQTVTIYGASDDLIEVEGDIEQEFYALYKPNEESGGILAFSDGTVLRLRYDQDGIWRIGTVARGKAKLVKVEGSVEEDTPDRVTLTGEIRWCVFGTEYMPAKKEK